MRGASTRGGIGIRTTHTFTADYIETEWRVTGGRTPDHAVRDLGAAARLIASADFRPSLHARNGSSGPCARTSS